MKMTRPSAHDLCICATVLILLITAAWVYQPALSGPFLLDDFHSLGTMSVGIDSVDDMREHLFAPAAGPTNRPVARFTYLINDVAWPTSAYPFKVTNLMLHLLCGLLVFVVARQILPRLTGASQPATDWLALAASGLWLLHPLNMSTTMYVVQRMAQLSALFVLVGCAGYLKWRPNAAHGFGRILTLSVVVGASALLATLSKENGILLFVLLAAIELTCFSSSNPQSPSAPGPLFAWWRRLAVYLPALLIIAYLAYWPQWQDRYAFRPFDVGQRLLSQIPILAEYAGRLLSLRAHGIGVFHDDQPIRHSLLDPPVLGASILWTVLLVLAVTLRRREPLIAFGLFWFLGAHLLESTTVALELYFDHRNYLPAAGLFIALAGGTYRVLGVALTHGRQFALALLAVLVVFAGLQTRLLAHPWGNADELYLLMATEHPESVRATRVLVRWMELNLQVPQALGILDATLDANPRDLSLPLISVDMTCTHGLPHRYDLQQLADQADSFHLTDGVVPSAQSLAKKLSNDKCPELLPGFHALMERATDFVPRVSGRNKHVTKLLRTNARILMDRDMYERARENLHLAYANYPSAGTAFELTRFWVRLSQPESALAWLERTQEHEAEARSRLRPDINPEFARQRAALEQALKRRAVNGSTPANTDHAIDKP